MNKKNIPFHRYSDTHKHVSIINGNPALSIDPDFPFVLTQFNYMEHEALSAQAHRHDYYEILFIEEGEGQHIIDFEAYNVKAPSYFFISKGQVHFWKHIKSLKGKALLFPREFLISPATNVRTESDLLSFDSLNKAPQLSIDESDLPKLQELLKCIEEEFNMQSGRSLSVIRSFIHILLIQLLRIYNEEHIENLLDTTHTMVRKFRQLVSDHFLNIRSVQEYAHMIGISTSHLRDSVKEITGYSPGQIIRQELIFEAKRKLANTTLTTAEIAYSLNFEDASYFSRFFKRETGISPLKFREEIMIKYQFSG
ncbi:helix-turn-helix domain-containing protein [Saccharicrinis fermentans]|uniref:L-rhamnose operon regulatory protein RhaS n=1 Tax=Saccharicrinis fermentans DSM 9555 = JCM 21142 TaxID=869213 RepID=W7YJZ0_9BACT|nr:helix-turn-helix domain-containing protein [Saccharicrinis fermentans]GAF04856.1 L-rhamnose operon regulatory protein RhaS [Saccharicrinis fermentans DSM 9555 = JCM 21142]